MSNILLLSVCVLPLRKYLLDSLLALFETKVTVELAVESIIEVSVKLYDVIDAEDVNICCVFYGVFSTSFEIAVTVELVVKLVVEIFTEEIEFEDAVILRISLICIS